MSANIQTYTAAEEISGVLYQGWTVWWWSWALQGPRATNPVYDTNGNNANRKQPRNYKVMFLAGTFDRESSKSKFTRRITSNTNTSILIPIVNSNISREEHDNVFNTSNGNAQVIGATGDIINNAQGSLHIETGGSSVDFAIGGSEDIAPVRITPGGMSPMFPGQGIINSHSGSDLEFMYSAMDGYWVFLKPLSAGQYTFTIHGQAPWFGEKGAPQFETDVTYEVTIT